MIAQKQFQLFQYFAKAQKPPKDYKDIKIFKTEGYETILEAQTPYLFCQCGHARDNSQPFCDGTHKLLKELDIPKCLSFQVEETKQYKLCLCKHSKDLPFCDGSHELL